MGSSCLCPRLGPRPHRRIAWLSPPLQLLGLASSVLLLQALEAAGHPEAAIPAWAAVHSVHVALRYASLRALRFPWPNQVGAGCWLLCGGRQNPFACRLCAGWGPAGASCRVLARIRWCT